MSGPLLSALEAIERRLARLEQLLQANASTPDAFTLDAKGLSDALSVGLRTVWRMAAAGELPPSVLVRGRRLWLRSDVEQWLTRKKRK